MKWSFDHRAPVHVDLRKNQWGNFEFRHAPHIVPVITSAPELNMVLPLLPPLA
jgi:hypothetical protein